MKHQRNLFELKSWENLTVDEALDLDMKIFGKLKAFKTMSLGAEGALAIIERLNLEVMYEYYLKMNESKTLPYHNHYHALCMILNCYEGAFYHELNLSDTRALVAAALMHDVNHSGGSFPDSTNVQIAVDCFVCAQKFCISRHQGLSDTEFATAVDCIKITQYPYVAKPDTISEGIIRDADLMQVYETDSMTLVAQFLGLCEEVQIQYDKLMTISEFATKNKEFLDSTAWCTVWAHQKARVCDWEEAKLNMYDLLIAYEREQNE